MVQEIRIKGKVYKASQTGMEFFTGDAVRHSNLLISLDIMRNCLDTIYSLVHRCYPKAVMPDLLVTDSEEVNACAIGNKYIIIHSGLIFKATEFIEQRYSEKLLKKYGILTNHTTDLLKDIENSSFDLGFTGFDPPEIETLFNKVHSKEVKEDDFDVDSELKQPVFSKEGDLWFLGKHRVFCGDSTVAESYQKLMDGQKANLVLTDPPYNVNVEETAGKIMNDNMGDSEFYNFLLAAYTQMYENLASDGSIYVFHADTEGLNFRKAFKEAGFYLSGCCIWKKNALVLGRSPYQWMHEPCLYGWRADGKHQWYSDRKQTTIWEYDRPKANKDHPTMKPIGLMSYPIRNSTMTNGIVLDPFLGSGSTLIACEETERVCRGIELDPKFMDVIVKRYIEHQDGKYGDVYVIRDGQKLKFDEVATFEPETEEAADGAE